MQTLCRRARRVHEVQAANRFLYVYSDNDRNNIVESCVHNAKTVAQRCSAAGGGGSRKYFERQQFRTDAVYDASAFIQMLGRIFCCYALYIDHVSHTVILQCCQNAFSPLLFADFAAK